MTEKNGEELFNPIAIEIVQRGLKGVQALIAPEFDGLQFPIYWERSTT
jgi:hypothetical protein